MSARPTLSIPHPGLFGRPPRRVLIAETDGAIKNNNKCSKAEESFALNLNLSRRVERTFSGNDTRSLKGAHGATPSEGTASTIIWGQLASMAHSERERVRTSWLVIWSFRVTRGFVESCAVCSMGSRTRNNGFEGHSLCRCECNGDLDG